MKISNYLSLLYWRHRILFVLHSLLAKFGVPKSMAYVSVALLDGTSFVKQDKDQAIRLAQASANKGCAKGYISLGYCYSYGHKADSLKAMSCFQKAVELGLPEASVVMASVYLDGKFAEVPKDIEKGERMLLSAIEKGNIYAKSVWANYLCGGTLTGDYTLARRYAEEALRHGEISSCAPLGYFLLNGLGGDADKELSNKFFEVGLSLGNKACELMILQSVLQGSTASPEEKANALARMKELAKEYEDPNVSLIVGIALAQGLVGEPEPIEAVEFVRLAIKCGSKDAICTLASFYANGICGLSDEAEAIRLYEEAEKCGVLNARLEMCFRRYLGNGVEMDVERAIEDLTKMVDEEKIGVAARSLSQIYWDLDEEPQSDKDKELCDKSLFWLRKGADLNDAESLFKLAQVYLYGDVVECDMYLAREYARRAWKAGCEEAQIMVADSYMWFDDKEPDKALAMFEKILEDPNPHIRQMAEQCIETVNKWKKNRETTQGIIAAADSGDTDAMINLALMHFRGQIPAADEETGRQLLYRAAELGNRQAVLRVGHGLVWGDCFPINIPAGLEYLHKAYDMGELYALCDIGRYYISCQEPDYAKAVEYFQKGVAEDEPASIFMYALCLRDGKGVAKDIQQSFAMARKSAEYGYVDAQWFLGHAYLYADNCEQNKEEAIKWLRSAAEAGKCEAMAVLGSVILQDEATEYYDKAYQYLYEASSHDDAFAAYHLALMYNKGLGPVEKNIKNEIACLKKASEKGYPKAMVVLARRYRDGEGVQTDNSASFFWLSKAVEAEEPGAMCDLAWHYYTGCAVEKDEDKAIKILLRAKELGEESAKDFLEQILAK